MLYIIKKYFLFIILIKYKDLFVIITTPASDKCVNETAERVKFQGINIPPLVWNFPNASKGQREY